MHNSRTKPAPFEPPCINVAEGGVVQDLGTLDPFFFRNATKWHAMLNSGVREGVALQKRRVDVCLKWCKISCVNSKGYATADGVGSGNVAQ